MRTAPGPLVPMSQLQWPNTFLPLARADNWFWFWFSGKARRGGDRGARRQGYFLQSQ